MGGKMMQKGIEEGVREEGEKALFLWWITLK